MIVLESGRAGVEVDPACGARVAALRNKRAGRDLGVVGDRAEGFALKAYARARWRVAVTFLDPA